MDGEPRTLHADQLSGEHSLTQSAPHPTYSPAERPSLTPTHRDLVQCSGPTRGAACGGEVAGHRTCGITPGRSWLTILCCFGGCFGSSGSRWTSNSWGRRGT